jgi:hypothetical protein
MMVPTVHLGGTSHDRLLETACEAVNALLAGLEAMERAAPNPRDYYPQGSGAFDAAAREHAERVARVRAVVNEMQQLASAIAG